MKLIPMHHEEGQDQLPQMIGSDYPYGLRLTLGAEQLEQLGIEGLPPAGTVVHLEAEAVVVRSSSEDPDADGDIDCLCVELQIRALGIEEGESEEEEENPVDAREKGAKKLYGGK